jgi:hypothetical protein
MQMVIGNPPKGVGEIAIDSIAESLAGVHHLSKHHLNFPVGIHQQAFRKQVWLRQIENLMLP